MKVFICACAVVFFVCGAKDLQTTAETKPRLTKTECFGKECQVGKNVGLTLLMHDVNQEKSEVVEKSEELLEATLGEEVALEEEDEADFSDLRGKQSFNVAKDKEGADKAGDNTDQEFTSDDDTPPPPPPLPQKDSMVQATDKAGDNTDQEFTPDGDTPPPPPPPQKDSMVQASSDVFPGMFHHHPSPGSARPRPTPRPTTHPTTADSANGISWIGVCYKFCRRDMTKVGQWEVTRDTNAWSWGYGCNHRTKYDWKNVWRRPPAVGGCVRGNHRNPHLDCSRIRKRLLVLCAVTGR